MEIVSFIGALPTWAFVIAVLFTLIGIGMALPASVTEEKLAELPEAVRGEYEKGEDGNYYLGLEGLEDADHPATRKLKSALQSERERNEARTKEIAQLKARTKDLDPEEFQRLKKLEKEVEEERAKGDPKKLDELVNARAAEREKDLQGQIDAEREKRIAAESIIDKRVVSDEIRRAAGAAGVQKEALDTVVMIARAQGWRRKGDGVVLMTGEGDSATEKFGKDGATPMTPEEWMPTLKESHAYLWGPSKGAGGQDDGGGDIPPASANPHKMTPRQKSEYIKKYGLDEWQKLLEKHPASAA